MALLPTRSLPPTIERLPISGTGIAVLELRAAIPGKRIRVLGYNLTVSGTVGLEFRSNTTALSGRMELVANGQARDGAGSGSLVGVFETADDEALNLDVDAAVNVRGHLEIVHV